MNVKDGSRSPQQFRLVVAAGTGLALLTGVGAYWIKANAERPELTLEMAIGDGTLPIAYGFEANNAVAELLVSLPPDLALDVCASLSGTVARTAQQPCAELREITAIAPAASSGLPQNAMDAAMSGGTPTALAAPELPPDVAPAPTAAAPPQPSSIRTPASPSEPSTAAMVAQTTAAPTEADPPAAMAASRLAASRAPIASAQTTKEPVFVAAADDRDSEATLLLELNEPVKPAATAIGDGTLARWLLVPDVSQRETADAADLDDGLTTEARAKLAAAASAAKARAQAKAKAIAAAKAKAKAKAARSAVNRRDADNTPANTGRGKDKDGGPSGSGGDGSSGEGGPQ